MSDKSTDSSDEEQYSRHSKKCFQKGKLTQFVTRPNASGGYWLSCLVPLALLVAYLKQPKTCDISNYYDEYALAAVGMFLQSVCFYIYAFLNLGLPVDLCISCLPAILTTLLYKWLLMDSWLYGFFWSFCITYGYQRIYIYVLDKLPRCFSYGEAAIFVQGLTLFLMNAAQQLPILLNGGQQFANIYGELCAIMMVSLLYFRRTGGIGLSTSRLATSTTTKRGDDSSSVQDESLDGDDSGN